MTTIQYICPTGSDIFRVYHIRIIERKKIGSHDMKQTYSSIIIVRNVYMLTSASMIVYLFFTRSWSAIIGPKLFFTRLWSAIIGTKQPKVNQSPQYWRGRKTCTRSCRFLVVGNIFRLETCMNSLVMVPSYSKLNFLGKIFFTENWCNITLICYIKMYFLQDLKLFDHSFRHLLAMTISLNIWKIIARGK